MIVTGQVSLKLPSHAELAALLVFEQSENYKGGYCPQRSASHNLAIPKYSRALRPRKAPPTMTLQVRDDVRKIDTPDLLRMIPIINFC
jgi:hypothetical protein